MELVRMLLQWEVNQDGHLTSHWVQDQRFLPPVDLSSRRVDHEGAPERAVSYVRKAPTAG